MCAHIEKSKKERGGASLQYRKCLPPRSAAPVNNGQHDSTSASTSQKVSVFQNQQQHRPKTLHQDPAIRARANSHIMQLFSILSLLALAVSALQTSITSEPDPIAIVDNYLFSLTLPEFTSRRESRDPPTLIWDSNGCSHAPDNPLRFPFLPGCQRHDFGYRNYKQQGRFDSRTKDIIDRNLRQE